MGPWDAAFERQACERVARVITGDVAAWRALLVDVAPRIEAWAKGSRVLRRCRLAGDDDARAVMVDVLERLAAGDHANLRRFVARQPAAPADDDALLAEVVKLGKLDDPDPPDARDAGTPLRAWLLHLVDFAARDHVRRRLGWVAAAPGEPSKRDVSTDASPLSGAPEPASRPPMTDRLTLQRLVAEVDAHVATFPDDMQRALRLWLDDADFTDIAAELGVAADKARALVRAAHARLRERFRGRSPLLFAA